MVFNKVVLIADNMSFKHMHVTDLNFVLFGDVTFDEESFPWPFLIDLVLKFNAIRFCNMEWFIRHIFSTDSLGCGRCGTKCRSMIFKLFHCGPVTPHDRRHGSGSTLAQVMACCLTARSHYLNQCWLIISKVHWHSNEGNFTRDTSATSH